MNSGVIVAILTLFKEKLDKIRNLLVKMMTSELKIRAIDNYVVGNYE